MPISNTRDDTGNTLKSNESIIAHMILKSDYNQRIFLFHWADMCVYK